MGSQQRDCSGLTPDSLFILSPHGHQEQNCDKISANRMKKQVYLYFSEVQPKLMYYIKIRISERIISSLLEYFGNNIAIYPNRLCHAERMRSISRWADAV